MQKTKLHPSHTMADRRKLAHFTPNTIRTARTRTNDRTTQSDKRQHDPTTKTIMNPYDMYIIQNICFSMKTLLLELSAVWKQWHYNNTVTKNTLNKMSRSSLILPVAGTKSINQQQKIYPLIFLFTLYIFSLF